MDRQKKITIGTLAVSSGISLLVIFLSPAKGWGLVFIVMGIIVGGQVVRYGILKGWFSKEKGEKPLTRKKMARQVTAFFDSNPEIAKRFLKMDELSKRARFHDALSIASALKKEKELDPIINKYLDYRIDKLKQMMRHGLA